MHIKSIYLKNFRGFEEETIPLNPQFTAAIGDNGKGKSTILYGLQVALGAYLQCLPIPASPVYRRQFKKSERFIKWDPDEKGYMSNRSETKVSVTAEFNPGKEISWTRLMAANGTTSHNRTLCWELMDTVESLLTKKDRTKKRFSRGC